MRIPRPSPTFVVACLALLVALGGTGYAAIKLPANSVTSVQVKDRSLLGQDFKAGQLHRRPSRAHRASRTGRRRAVGARAA